MKYGKLDMFCNRVRDEEEVERITEDIIAYRNTKNIEFIQKYLKIHEDVNDYINTTNFSSSFLACILYDEMHPLSKEDKKRWREHMLKKLKSLNIK